MIQPLSLYAITEELQQLEHALIESGGEITPEMEEKYDDLLTLHEDKIESYIRIIRKFEVTAKAIKEEADRLISAQKSMQNAAQSMKDRMRDGFITLGITDKETPLGKVRLMTSGTRPVEVLEDDVTLIPEKYLKVDIKVNKAAIKKDLGSEDEVVQAEVQKVARWGEASQYVRIF